jgi:hypothetical protein
MLVIEWAIGIAVDAVFDLSFYEASIIAGHFTCPRSRSQIGIV